jgi:hypothetical protein
MPTNAATRRAPAKPRETAAQKRARVAADTTTQQSGSVESSTPPAPEIAGGAVRITTAGAAPIEREVLFYVDDVPYTIPKRFGYGKTLAYAHVARTQGLSAAVAWAMEWALGTVGFQVLFSADQVSDEDCERMTAFVIGRMEGVPDPK